MPDHSGQKPKPALADVQLDEPTERHRSNHHHRFPGSFADVDRCHHLGHFDELSASESLGRRLASECNFGGLLGSGLGDATQAGFRQ